LGKTLDELKQLAAELALPSYSAAQICNWLYIKKVSEITEMTNISLPNRQKLAEKAETGRTNFVKETLSGDGTKKYLFRTAQGNFIESVYIPDDERHTLCISAQAGCKMNCLFCMTGKLGFKENLSAADILNQLFSIPESELITNVVFMGMGEPLDNLQEVLHAIEILTAPQGCAWSPHRITVSTIGISGKTSEFLEKSDCHLAISLHSPFHDERLKLMPMEKIHPFGKILDELRRFDFSHQRRLSFEYILFAGINDTQAHAKALTAMLNGLNYRINLIHFHAIPGVQLSGSNKESIFQFQAYLQRKGIITTLRKSRGEDIFAACGMLAGSLP
jgi:23S rRNA (adenine2503-C2)-methyltransferase